MTTPTPPTPIDAESTQVQDRFPGPKVVVPDAVLQAITATGALVSTDGGDRAEAGRDWWPLAISWAAEGRVGARPGVVVRPHTAAQVQGVLVACCGAGIPVTPAAGRSGVCGGSIPAFGGVALDLTGLDAPITVDEDSLIADVPAGVFGPDLEASLRATGPGYTLGHWPQSMDLSTVGGWLACRGAGQYSTRYGKIEELVLGLDVVLADGTALTTDASGPRAATGPNLTQLFVGSEGTLGVITSARLRIRPVPAAEGRRAFGFETFADGLDAGRRILRRGATPAVLRLYDPAESARHFDHGQECVMIVLDEADPGLVDWTLAIVDEECARPGASGAVAGRVLDRALVQQWFDHRNDVSALAPLWRAAVAVDTAEVSGPWSILDDLCAGVLDALGSIEGTLVASVHESHAYTDGACLYFTFAGRRPDLDESGPDTAIDARSDAQSGAISWEESYYQEAWNTLSTVVIEKGGALSHHHGIGLNRGRFLGTALGGGFGVLSSIKAALDPTGILNPGKLGLSSPFGPTPWP